jgi:four helix bundle protein
MATITEFEDLKVWQQARQLAKEIYSKSIQGSFSRDCGLRDQINRSAGSVMDNIAEGFERDGRQEFI